jgi:hypothetical protein
MASFAMGFDGFPVVVLADGIFGKEVFDFLWGDFIKDSGPHDGLKETGSMQPLAEFKISYLGIAIRDDAFEKSVSLFGNDFGFERKFFISIQVVHSINVFADPFVDQGNVIRMVQTTDDKRLLKSK